MQFLSIFKAINQADIGLIVILSICLLLCLLLTSICAASENALFSHREVDLNNLKNKNTTNAARLLYMLSKPKKLLATILIMNSFGVVAFVILSRTLIEILFNTHAYPWLSFVIDSIFVTLLVLIIGEVTPKIYGTHYYVQTANIVAFPMRFFMKITNPLSSVLVSGSDWLEKHIQTKPTKLSAQELSQAIDITVEQKGTANEKDILKGIIQITHTLVTQIMRPRMDICFIDKSWNFTKILKFVSENQYSRYPVMDFSNETVIGVLYGKDLIAFLEKGNEFKWLYLVKTPLFVPEIKKIDDLLQLFREKRNHMAIVVDEYGVTQGLVTMEDIIEEVFGEIHDEYDEVETTFVKLAHNVFVFPGKTLLIDFSKITQIPMTLFNEVENETIGGLLTEIHGKTPSKNTIIEFGNVKFLVESSNVKRINSVKAEIQD